MTTRRTRPSHTQGQAKGSGPPPSQPPPGNQTALEVRREKHPIEAELWAQRDLLNAILPTGFGADRLIGAFAAELSGQSDLSKCDKWSVIGGLYMAARVGLEINGPSGDCYLIPYGKQATFVLGYRGARKLALRSPEIAKVETALVWDGDGWVCERSVDGWDWRHEPDLRGVDNEDADKILGGYLVATQTNRLIPDTFHPVRGSYLRKVRDFARSKNKREDGPWFKWEPQMMLKTVVKSGVKHLPHADDVALAIRTDDQGEAGKQDLEDLVRTEMQKATAITIRQLERRDEAGVVSVDEIVDHFTTKLRGALR